MEPVTINPNRIDLDEAYMRMAEVWAQRSKANRRQVGALIVKDKQIISDGYNGLPAGDKDDVCETVDPATGELRTKQEVLHAESNAIAKIAENGGVGAQGATLYVTMSPCADCAKLIKQSKIKRVVFREFYRDMSGIEFLLNRGVVVDHLAGTNPPTALPSPPPPPAPREVPKPAVNPEVARLRSLAAIAGKPATPAPSPPAVPQPSPVVDDVMAALAAAGISLDDGVPVEKPSGPAPRAADTGGGYVSTFL